MPLTNFGRKQYPLHKSSNGQEQHDSKATSFSFMTALKSCAQRKDLYHLRRIHAEIRNSGLLNKVASLGNTLVSVYAKCGALAKAREILDELPAQNVVSWNALIAGYAQHERGKEALDCFHQMRSEKGLSPDAVTYACTLKACGILQDVAMGERIHNEVASQGLLEKHVVLGGALVDMYAKCGALAKARKVLDELPAQNVVSWSALIAGYAQHGCGKEALDCFHQMRSKKGLSPDSITYACTLKACGIIQDIAMGERIHDEVASQGLLEKHVRLGGALVDMYSKCGALMKARKVLDELPTQNVVSWSALIAGYVQHGCGKEALDCFHHMRSEKGFSPDAITYACTLKACGIVQDVAMGERIHDEVASRGLLEKHVMLGGALVDMYAKCGTLLKARKVLDELPTQNVVSWSALIAGYAQHGYGKEALDCFHQMRSEKGLSPDAVTYACTLKACGIVQDVAMGERIHDEVASQGLLKKHVVLGGALVDMYAKCGALTKARKVLDELPVRNVVSWSSLIVGYAQHGCGREALDCFHQMKNEKGLSPDAITYAYTLKSCGIVQDLAMGERIHDEVTSQGLLEKHGMLGGALVDMYAKCGALSKAREVLDELPAQDVVCWSALIAGYAQHGCGKEALNCFHQMRSEKGLSPDAITYACTLKACSIVQDIAMGEIIHDEVASQGLLEKHVMLGGALVDMYAKCGALTKARKVLDELPAQNVISWSALIAGYAQHGCGKEALECFHQMRREKDLSPDTITYACTLKACGIVQDIAMGERIHDELASQGLLEKHVMLGGALVGMYAKCGALTKARKVLYELPVRDVVCWNSLIAGYAQRGRGKEALDCFHQMRSDKGLSPDAITYAYTLKACGIVQDVAMGERIHDEVASQGLLEKNVVLGCALVDMYAKCGTLTKAREVLDELRAQHVVSWSALIAGYAQHGCGKEALDCFHQMRSEKGLSPDAITYACILKACGIVQDLAMGKEIHDEVASKGLLEKHVMLGSALVDMYAKCGAFSKARKALDELPARNVVSWSALIAGYAQSGYGKEALNCFCRMQHEGTSPDAITFLSMLNACSHSGLVDEGQMLFDSMREKYGIVPGVEHYTCMVDLFGRARHFDKAMRVIKMMPLSDDPSPWSALLSSCQKWGNVELGRLAFERAVELDEHYGAVYVLMSNIYAAAGMYEEAQNIENMKESGMVLGSSQDIAGGLVQAATTTQTEFPFDLRHFFHPGVTSRKEFLAETRDYL